MSYSSRSSDPVQELLANAHNFLPIALALAAWAAATWSKLKKKQTAAVPPAADEAERTRRVQEEVRRKIAERRIRPAEEPRTAESRPASVSGGWRDIVERRIAAPSTLDPFGGPGRRAVRPAPAPERFPPADQDDPAVLERQRRLAAMSRAVEPAAVQSTTRLPAFGTALDAQPAVVSPWLTELREPAGVRRAILLREILGPPVGLR